MDGYEIVFGVDQQIVVMFFNIDIIMLDGEELTVVVVCVIEYSVGGNCVVSDSSIGYLIWVVLC